MTKEERRISVWNTTLIREESLMMLRDEAGDARAPLLFPPCSVLRVTDSAGETEYEEGRDWILRDGQICLTPDSRIPAFTGEELYPTDPKEGESFPMPGGNVLFHEGDFFIRRQIAVTYTCPPGCWNGVRPTLAEAQLPRTFRKLRGGEELSLVVYGDSISYGANATGLIGVPPFQPNYPDQLAENLRDAYPGKITLHNPSVGGKETVWALECLDELVIDHHPDLLVIAFGMNDGDKKPDEFGANVSRMVERVREKCPECEFILVATTLPNSLLTHPDARFCGNQRFFKDALDAVADRFGDGIAVADVQNMHRHLLDQKRFIDLTSNNVNHPNDFLYRCQADFLSDMLIP